MLNCRWETCNSFYRLLAFYQFYKQYTWGVSYFRNKVDPKNLIRNFGWLHFDGYDFTEVHDSANITLCKKIKFVYVRVCFTGGVDWFLHWFMLV